MDRMASIELAMKNEKTEMEYYLRESERSSNPVAKALFRTLAADEAEHMTRIQGLHRKLIADGAWPEDVAIEVAGTNVRDVLDGLLGKSGSGEGKSGDDIAALKQGAEFEEKGAVLEGELADYVARVGARIARAAGLEDGEIVFTLLDDSSVNAFAMQGGYVFVARGLLAYLETEDQLAAVLGHEIGHLTGRHPQERKTAARTSAIGSTLLGFITRSGALYQTAQAYSAAAISGYGREQELEADGLGAKYLAAAGYDPIAMLEVVRVLKDQDLYASQVERRASSYHGLFASHPRNDRRLYEVIRAGGASAEPPERVAKTTRLTLFFGGASLHSRQTCDRPEGLVRASPDLDPKTRGRTT